MDHTSIKQYLKHYGKIRSLRGSVVRSTFRRVTAVYDNYERDKVMAAMECLGPDVDQLKCVYCDSDATCWDHLSPAALGGTHQLANLAPSCSPCNSEKGAKDWKVYLKDIGQDERGEIWNKLALHTAGYQPRDSFLNRDEQSKFDALLNEIHAKMEEADKIVGESMKRQGIC